MRKVVARYGASANAKGGGAGARRRRLLGQGERWVVVPRE
jgi:hypothetical protein